MFYLTGWLRSVLSATVTTQGVERASDGGAGDIQLLSLRDVLRRTLA